MLHSSIPACEGEKKWPERGSPAWTDVAGGMFKGSPPRPVDLSPLPPIRSLQVQFQPGQSINHIRSFHPLGLSIRPTCSAGVAAETPPWGYEHLHCSGRDAVSLFTQLPPAAATAH